jgi:plastocyanin
MVRMLALVAATLAVFAAVACGDDEEEETGGTENGGQEKGVTVEVEAGDFFFQPASLEAKVGQPITVKFTNSGQATHTFTVDEFRAEAEAAGGEEAEVTFTPNEAGEFTFYCRIHPSQMQGSLRVTGGGGGTEGGETSPTQAAGSGAGGYMY